MKHKRIRDPALLQRIRNQPCVICGARGPSDPSHIKSVGAGGPDTDWNVFAFCRRDHVLWHTNGRITFLKRHPEFLRLLELHGWELIEKTLSNPKFFATKEIEQEIA